MIKPTDLPLRCKRALCVCVSVCARAAERLREDDRALRSFRSEPRLGLESLTWPGISWPQFKSSRDSQEKAWSVR